MAQYDTLILGAGAAGMMCAASAAAKGGRVLVIDHAKAPGEKIRISGGGRCNFTNLYAAPENFLSQNPHFCKSALSRYTQYDFINLVDRHGIGWHEKTLGQLFCDGSSKEIIALLLDEMAAVSAELRLQTSVDEIAHADGLFRVRLAHAAPDQPREHTVTARNLVIATGGKSIPKMGASGLGYRVAEQFALAMTETRPALVPFTLGPEDKARFAELAGVSAPVRLTGGAASFDEALLFTHRGVSGPAALQVSSYWREGEAVHANLMPDHDPIERLRAHRHSDGKRQIATVLGEVLPKRLAQMLTDQHGWTGRIGDQSDRALERIAAVLTAWEITPAGTEGYRTAEVTLGGVATEGLSSRTMEATAVPGLYFIGECVDVTGWLGGYNFQWAWSSGWAAGTAIAGRG